MSRVRRVADREEMEQLVDEFIIRGYKVSSQGESSTRLKKKDWGDGGIHLLIAVLTVWWTFGLANALYAIYKRVAAEEVVIRIDDKNSETIKVDSAVETSKSKINKKAPVRISLQLFSLIIAGFVLLTVFASNTGHIGLENIIYTIVTLTVAVLFRYIAVYHRFKKEFYRQVLIIPVTVALVVSSVFTGKSFVDTVTVGELRRVFQTDSIVFQSSSFLPEWWVAAILVPAGLLMLLGSLFPQDLAPYPKPDEIRTTAISPVYFGFFCSFFGLWAVLFVGISIQRVVVIAPIFEELLKFGIALLVGSALFDRSVSARIGVAVVVGSLFGLVEHATTYPAEADSFYLFRTLFHMMTTVLSVSLYTYFESEEMHRRQWLAPAFSTLIHFFYNTFAVISSLMTFILIGSRETALTLVYGGVAILAVTSLVILVLLRHRSIDFLYMSLENTLSDLI